MRPLFQAGTLPGHTAPCFGTFSAGVSDRNLFVLDCCKQGNLKIALRRDVVADIRPTVIFLNSGRLWATRGNIYLHIVLTVTSMMTDMKKNSVNADCERALQFAKIYPPILSPAFGSFI